jgi:hypothetical protein
VNRKELVGLGLLIAGVTAIPYIMALASQDETWVFTGFLFGVEDGNSYLAKMLYGKAGGWLFRSPYSTADQAGVIAFVPYILLGKLAGSTQPHDQLVALYQAFRLTSIFVAVFATYKFVARFIQSEAWRLWATFIGILGGGLGWLLILLGAPEWLGSPPLEFYSPESFGFLAVFGIPHLILSRSIMLTALLCYLDAPDSPRRGWIAGALLTVLGLVHPVSMVPFAIVVAAHSVLTALLFRDRSIAETLSPLLRTLVPAAPLLIYYAYIFSTDNYLSGWTAQNIIRSPHPAHYLLAYGLLLIPAAKGASSLLRSRNREALLPVLWLVLLPFLAYAPHNLQRRLPEGIWISLVILGAIGLTKWSIGGRFLRLALSGPLLLSSAFILFGAIEFASSPSDPMFRTRNEVQAFHKISELAQPGDVVLSSFKVGNALPAWVAARVVIGHGPETINLEQLESQVNRYYSGDLSSQDAAQFLDDHEVSIVFYGPIEQAQGSVPELSLDLVYSDEAYQLFITR